MRRDLYTDKDFQSNAVNHGHEPGEMTATRLYGAGVKKQYWISVYCELTDKNVLLFKSENNE